MTACAHCFSQHPVDQACPVVFSVRTPETESLVGLKLGPLTLTAKLGLRALGTVYEAQPGLFGVPLAVKVFHPVAAQDSGLLTRLYAQAQALQELADPQLPHIFAVRECVEGHHCLVMEHVHGESCLHRTEPLSAARVVELLLPLVTLMDRLHLRGKGPLGLNPEQVVLVENGSQSRLRVMDFGILTGPSLPLASMARAGRLFPASPTDAGLRADLHALAVVGCWLLTGAFPSLEPSVEEETGSAGPLLSVLRRALSEDAQKRYRHPGELKAALETLRAPLESVPLAPALSRMPQAREPTQLRFRRDAEETVTALGFSELSCAGLFIAYDGPLPALAQRLEVELVSGSQQVFCEGDVVRHVCAEEASIWGTQSGFFLQFEALSGAAQDFIEQELLTLPRRLPDRELQRLLARFPADAHDPYAVLELAGHADFPQVQRQAEAQVRRLRHFNLKPLPSEQRRALERQLTRVEDARALLEDPVRRAAYDAEQGNVEGVARCLGAGISAPTLTQLRAQYLRFRPGMEARAQLRAEAGAELYAMGSLQEAVELYGEALALDPLNVKLQQRYWTLRRQQSAARSAEAHAA